MRDDASAVTAGDLIRRELEGGATALGLAKRLAGSDDDADPEVKRWRYIVMRAAKGSEPASASAELIARTFGEAVEPPRSRLSVMSLERRLEALAEADDEIQANQHKALLVQEQMLVELREIRAALETARTGRRAAPKRKAQQ